MTTRSARTLSSSDINAYLREVSGGKFTAKDFRTWAGTLSAAQALDEIEPPASKTAANRSIVQAVDRVAEALGNTRAVCRKCYIHPAVLDAFTDGVTLSRVTSTGAPPGCSIPKPGSSRCCVVQAGGERPREVCDLALTARLSLRLPFVSLQSSLKIDPAAPYPDGVDVASQDG